MKQRIAIEPNLTPVGDFLKDKGYRVESINFNQETANRGDTFDAYVVTGQTTNFLGMNDTNTKAVVVSAAGLTPEQVYHELQLRLE